MKDRGDRDMRNTPAGPFLSTSLSQRRAKVRGAVRASVGGEGGGVCGLSFRRVLDMLHKTKRKVEEEAVVMGIAVPDDLAFMAIVVGGVEAAVSSVSDAFDEYMRWFMEQNQLVYIPLPPMLDLVRAAMGIIASTSSPPVPAANFEAPAAAVNSEVPAHNGIVRSSATPSPSIHAPDNDEALPPSSDPRSD
ncbi:hypothetical protein M9H77_22440 [Catharanthus roseus]|uniref:Uncharacterized protein n=1 Tax=Catharanthus roseus TaxID=4058 RepID=A0ACC0AQ38_CATRO|nr:hypothetical protein M9H77_22440 [Catharanthus roseus]